RLAQADEEIHQRWQEFQQRCKAEEGHSAPPTQSGESDDPAELERTQNVQIFAASDQEADLQRERLRRIEEQLTRHQQQLAREQEEFTTMKQQWVQEQT